MEFVHQPAPSNRLGEYLDENLSSDAWTHFRAAVAFVKRSGTRHVAPALTAFARTGDVEIIAGIDHRGTSAEGLRDLLDATSPRGRVVVFHDHRSFTFHPKVYLFKSSSAADVLVGSGNLTQGGLFTNYEAALRLSLDLNDPKQRAFLASLEQVFDSWADLSTGGAARVLDDALLARLTTELDLVPSEGLERDTTKTPPRRADFPFAARLEYYRAPAVPRLSPIEGKAPPRREAPEMPPESPAPQRGGHVRKAHGREVDWKVGDRVFIDGHRYRGEDNSRYWLATIVRRSPGMITILYDADAVDDEGPDLEKVIKEGVPGPKGRTPDPFETMQARGKWLMGRVRTGRRLDGKTFKAAAVERELVDRANWDNRMALTDRYGEA